MLAMAIFRHSVRQVTGNFGPALRLTLVPTVLQYGLGIAIGSAMFPDQAALASAVKDGHPPIVGVVAIVVVALFCSTWIAVAWHRFVLRADDPHGWLPPFHGRRMLAYLGRSITIAVAILGVELAVGVPLSAILAALGGGAAGRLLGILFGAGFIVLALAALFRLGPMLPSAALGAGVGLREAWDATRGQNAMLLGLAAVFLAAALVLSLPEAIFASMGLMIFALAWRILAGWAAALVLLSILTTLYGHFVERRPLV